MKQMTTQQEQQQQYIDKLKAYYPHLLIKQYHGKPKATQTIKDEVSPYIDIAFTLKAISNDYSIDNAKNGLLDIIGSYYGISRNINNKYYLTGDEDYRFILKLKLINMLQLKSIQSIGDSVYEFFNNQVIVYNHYDMTITYWIRDLSTLLKEVLQQYPDLLPSPSAVGVRIVYGTTTFFGVITDGHGDYTSPKRTGVVKDGETQVGEMLEDGDNIHN